MQLQNKILIVGGGVAGPVLGLFLRKAGIPAAVYEAYDGPAHEGGALGLEVNGMAVLKAAGVLPQVQAASVQSNTWTFENQRGKLLACLPTASGPDGLKSVMIMRSALHQAVAAAAAEAGVEMNYGKRLVAVEDIPGKPVLVRFEDGSTAEGDILVGADGIRSQVRQCVMPGAPKPEFTGMLAPGGVSPCNARIEPGSPQKVHFVFGQNGFFGHVNALTADGPCTMWWSTAVGELPDREERARRTKQDWQQELLRLHGDWAQPIPQLIESAQGDILDIAIHDIPSLPGWSAGRTVLIGDAAHAVAPHSGQGASMALEDAMLLAKLLRDYEGNNVREVFWEFEAERRPRTDRVIALGRKRGRSKEKMSAAAYWIQQQMMRIFVPLMGKKDQGWLLNYSIDW